MSQLDTSSSAVNIASNSASSDTNAKYWCFMCEKEFSKQRSPSAEVYCPECNCICEQIETDDDPRNFKPYDAEVESLQTPPRNIRQNSNRQPTQGPQRQQRLIQQRIAPSSEATSAQDDANALAQSRRNARAQLNPGPNQQGEPRQRIQVISIGGDMLPPPIMMTPFGMMNAVAIRVPLESILFGDLEDRIIEEFLRNDPNRYGPPPAPEESISKLKEIQYSEETCKVKDCPVCHEDFNNGENLTIMPCEHTFHKECLNTWLRMHNSCPVCRKSLESGAETDA